MSKKKLPPSNDKIPEEEMLLAEALAEAHARKLQWCAYAPYVDGECCAVGALALVQLTKEGKPIPKDGGTGAEIIDNTTAIKLSGLGDWAARSVMDGNDSYSPDASGRWVTLGIAFRQAFGDQD